MVQGFGIAFFVCCVVWMMGGIAIGILFVVAAWKAARASESIAESVTKIAETLKIQSDMPLIENENKDIV